ncbi:hypothetical protein OGAPHI_003324 [Ogataea philodendri]|uniref:Uncharacterized protein n=1 Tax=Ogataea philodendri TaxID=1378263 RepID=A0A9P8T699_9ASCO|nr:uncharacterized protein OGAPHI_003324 [Ogataea philodendri]KAH3666875.1 hypothetical protein OGAPHI_003324 [Ogataea philodendri]
MAIDNAFTTFSSTSSNLNFLSGSSWFSRYSGRSTLNHSSSRISLIVILLSGFTTSIFVSKCFAPSDKSCGSVYTPLLIFLNNAGISSSSNGNRPHNITYNMTPQDQTSTSGPAYNLPEITSGAA